MSLLETAITFLGDGRGKSWKLDSWVRWHICAWFSEGSPSYILQWSYSFTVSTNPKRVPFSPHPVQLLLLSVFFIIHFNWNEMPHFFFIYNSLMAGGTEHFPFNLPFVFLICKNVYSDHLPISQVDCFVVVVSFEFLSDA